MPGKLIDTLKYASLLYLAYQPLTLAAIDEIAGTRNSVSLSGQLGSLSPKLQNFRWQITNQTRTRDDSSKGMRLSDNLLSGQIGYALNQNFSVGIGYLHGWIHPLDRPSFQENRPYEDLLLNYTSGDFKFTSRSRLEQRIRVDNGGLGIRARELLQITYTLSFIDKNLTAYVGDEVLGYLNSNTYGHTGFNENRALAGFGYQFTKELNIDLGYLGQYIQGKTRQNLYIDNVQFNINYKF